MAGVQQQWCSPAVKRIYRKSRADRRTAFRHGRQFSALFRRCLYKSGVRSGWRGFDEDSIFIPLENRRNDAGVSLLMAVAAVLVGLLASRVGAGVGRELREKVFNKVVVFSNSEINHFSTASLITRSTNDIQQVQMVSTILLRLIFYAPILAIGGVIMVVQTGAGWNGLLLWPCLLFFVWWAF